jgi:hypothetical protein
MPFRIYRHALDGKRIDEVTSYASLNETEQSYFEQLVTAPQLDSTVLARMRDPYADCIIGHDELGRLLKDLARVQSPTTPKPLRSALAKLEAAASNAQAERLSLVIEGD